MGLLDSNAPQWLPIDPISGNRKIIEPEHAAIHAGLHFTVSVLTTTSSYLTLGYTTPAASTKRRAHFVFSANTDKAAVISFSQDAVISGGTLIHAVNNNCESNMNNTGIWVADPVVTTIGTVLERHLIGSAGTGASRPGGNASARNEWYLCYGKTYLIQIACGSASTMSEITAPYYYRTEPS
jgi:hypothetical protein